jgi:hypothetical protein
VKKICRGCNQSKDIRSFYRHRAKCKKCHRKTTKAQSAANYLKNKQAYFKRSNAALRKIVEFVRAYKHLKPCADCKVPHPYWRLDFDHLPGNKKMFNLAYAKKVGSMKRVIEEIQKCEVVCANCHRDRTHMRRQRESNAQP